LHKHAGAFAKTATLPEGRRPFGGKEESFSFPGRMLRDYSGYAAGFCLFTIRGRSVLRYRVEAVVFGDLLRKDANMGSRSQHVGRLIRKTFTTEFHGTAQEKLKENYKRNPKLKAAKGFLCTSVKFRGKRVF
jgi:hypothetical protein